MDFSTNYSLYAIPAAWFLALIPHSIAGGMSKAFDLRSPRTYQKNLEKDQTLDQATKDRIIRCESASANGFENLSFFACAVVAGNLAGLPPSTLNKLAGSYLATRTIYNLVYINNTNVKVATLRSLIWMVSVGQIITLYVKAGNVLRTKPANLI